MQNEGRGGVPYILSPKLHSIVCVQFIIFFFLLDSLSWIKQKAKKKLIVNLLFRLAKRNEKSLCLYCSRIFILSVFVNNNKSYLTIQWKKLSTQAESFGFAVCKFVNFIDGLWINFQFIRHSSSINNVQLGIEMIVKTLLRTRYNLRWMGKWRMMIHNAVVCILRKERRNNNFLFMTLYTQFRWIDGYLKNKSFLAAQ